eukprot:3296809-Alexandrium_andersonii.AAC.1
MGPGRCPPRGAQDGSGPRVQQAHALRTVVLAWAGEAQHLRSTPFSVDPPDWRPAAWEAKLTLHMPGLL